MRQLLRCGRCGAARSAVVAGLLAALVATGCKGMIGGYSFRAPYDTNIKTVYVPTFQSITFRRDIQLQITELVCKEIERRTPYKVVGKPDGADATLAGTMNYAEKNIIVANPDLFARQLTGTIIVAVTLTDNTLAEADRKAPNPAVVPETFNFFPEIGEPVEAAFYRCAERMATQIVNMMEQNW